MVIGRVAMVLVKIVARVVVEIVVRVLVRKEVKIVMGEDGDKGRTDTIQETI